MLTLRLSDRKKPVSYTYIPPTTAVIPPSSPVNMEIYMEAKRREGIVHTLVKNCPYKEGDDVISIKGESVQVIRICKEYIHMGKDEVWPPTDNPFLVTAKYADKNTIFNCTINYLEKRV